MLKKFTLNYVTTSSSNTLDKARTLAKQCKLPLKPYTTACPTFPHFRLCITEQRLEVQTKTERGMSILFTEFVKGSLGYRRRIGGGLRQPIARAVGIKSLKDRKTILDATAGLGIDGFVLASLGCKVEWVERSPIIGALLKDGLARAYTDPELKSIIEDRVRLHIGDAIKILKEKTKEEAPQVIYLDPMYPDHSKSALNKIELRIIRSIVGDDLDAEELLKIALKVATQRVVVKRPPHAPHLTNRPPSLIVASKKNRYDVYLTTENIKASGPGPSS